MAKVPTAASLGTVQETLGPTVFQNVSATPAAFGSDIGAAQAKQGQVLAGLGAEFGDLAETMQAEDNDREIEAAKTALQEKINNIGFGDGTPTNPGFYGMNGETALNADASTRDAIRQAQGEIGSGLSNPLVQQRFAALSASMITNEYTRISRHTIAQRKVASAATAKAVHDEALDTAALNFSDDSIVMDAIDRAGESKAFEMAELGLGPEAISSAMEAARSNVARAAIIAAIKGKQITRAQELFDAFSAVDPETGEATLDGRAIPELTAMLSEQTDIAAAQVAVDVIVSQTTHPLTGQIDKKEAFAAVRALPSGTVRDNAENELRQRITDNKAIIQQETDDAVGELAQHISQGGDKAEWTFDNPGRWANIQRDPAAMDTINKHIRNRADGREHVQLGDDDVFEKFYFMDDAQIIVADLGPVKSQLTKEHYDRLVTKKSSAIAEAKSGTTNGVKNSERRAARSEARGIVQRVAATTEAAVAVEKGGRFIDEESIRTAARQKQLMTQAMDEWLDTWFALGKIPPISEVNKHARLLALQIVSGRETSHIFSRNTFQFEVIGGNARNLPLAAQIQAKTLFDSIPPETKFRINDLFQRKVGRSATKGEMEQYAAAELLGQTGRMFRLLAPQAKRVE